MRIENCELIDAERGIFRVLGLVDVALRAPLQWVAEDMNTTGARGVCFRGYRAVNEMEKAYLVVADVTEDPEEPLIDSLDSSTAQKLDKLLETSTRRACEQQDLPMVEWMNSHPNTFQSRCVLVSAYKVEDPNVGLRQRITFRVLHLGRKLAIESAFNVVDAEHLAKPMFESLHPVNFVSRH